MGIKDYCKNIHTRVHSLNVSICHQAHGSAAETKWLDFDGYMQKVDWLAWEVGTRCSKRNSGVVVFGTVIKFILYQNETRCFSVG